MGFTFRLTYNEWRIWYVGWELGDEDTVREVERDFAGNSQKVEKKQETEFLKSKFIAEAKHRARANGIWQMLVSAGALPQKYKEIHFLSLALFKVFTLFFTHTPYSVQISAVGRPIDNLCVYECQLFVFDE